MMLQTSTQNLMQRIVSATGSVTLRLINGTDLTGTATVSKDQRLITLTAGSTVWTVPEDALLAVGHPA